MVTHALRALVHRAGKSLHRFDELASCGRRYMQEILYEASGLSGTYPRKFFKEGGEPLNRITHVQNGVSCCTSVSGVKSPKSLLSMERKVVRCSSKRSSIFPVGPLRRFSITISAIPGRSELSFILSSRWRSE